MFGNSLKCSQCQATYLAGTAHICANNDRKTSENKLERFLVMERGGFELEHK